MAIVLIGLNHHTAPVEVREKLAFSASDVQSALKALRDFETVNECLIISTCNRVEFLADAASADALLESIYKIKGISPGSLDQHFFCYEDGAAVNHAFRVAASLDSMIVGEPQILGQVKEAFQLAQDAGTVSHHLTRLMNRAFSVAKRVRNETAVAAHAVSISHVAVELARKVFDSVDGTTVLLLGAGEMAELAARHFLSNGASRLIIANRTLDNARKLASELNGEATTLDEMPNFLPAVDVILCSTGANHYLVLPEHIREALASRRNRTMFLIDISVPRNIDPAINELENAFVFDIDDLESVASANLKERQKEARRAEEIVAAESARFVSSQAGGSLNELIGAFRREVQQMALEELERSRKKLGSLSEEQEEALHLMLNSLINKFTNPVIKQIRDSEDGHSSYIEAFREFYRKDKH